MSRFAFSGSVRALPRASGRYFPRTDLTLGYKIYVYVYVYLYVLQICKICICILICICMLHIHICICKCICVCVCIMYMFMFPSISDDVGSGRKILHLLDQPMNFITFSYVERTGSFNCQLSTRNGVSATLTSKIFPKK